MNLLLGLAVVLTLCAAVVFLLFGTTIVRKLPPVKRLQKVKSELVVARIPRTALSGGELELGSVCIMRLEELADGNKIKNSTYQEFQKRPIGDVVEIVYYRDNTLRKILKELKVYAFLLLMLGCVSIIKDVPPYLEKTEDWKTVGVLEHLGQSPFEVLALFELVVIGFFLLRLLMEIAAIKGLLEEE